jgi:diacylglycerol O-acyltransferase
MADAARRMSRVDTAWLRMDNDVNLMMIVGVWLLAPAVTLDALRERIADKLLKYDRFRQKVVHDAMGAMWVEDERLRHRAPRGAEDRCTRKKGESRARRCSALCGELAMTPLDPRHPLWQFTWSRTTKAAAPGGAHPPLHRRRHRADLGHDVDHRRRQRPAQGAQEARP